MRSTIIECDLVGRYITLEKPDGGYFQVCEIEAYSTDDMDKYILASELGDVHFEESSVNILENKAAT